MNKEKNQSSSIIIIIIVNHDDVVMNNAMASESSDVAWKKIFHKHHFDFCLNHSVHLYVRSVLYTQETRLKQKRLGAESPIFWP